MGDRCSVDVYVPKEYTAKFIELTTRYFGEPGDTAQVGACDKLYYEEVDYGGDEDLYAATEAKIPFYVEQGAGHDYGPEMSVSNGEGYRTTVRTFDHNFIPFLTVSITGDKCETNLEELLHIQHFAKELYKAKQTWMR